MENENELNEQAKKDSNVEETTPVVPIENDVPIDDENPPSVDDIEIDDGAGGEDVPAGGEMKDVSANTIAAGSSVGQEIKSSDSGREFLTKINRLSDEPGATVVRLLNFFMPVTVKREDMDKHSPTCGQFLPQRRWFLLSQYMEQLAFWSDKQVCTFLELPAANRAFLDTCIGGTWVAKYIRKGVPLYNGEPCPDENFLVDQIQFTPSDIQRELNRQYASMALVGISPTVRDLSGSFPTPIHAQKP